MSYSGESEDEDITDIDEEDAEFVTVDSVMVDDGDLLDESQIVLPLDEEDDDPNVEKLILTKELITAHLSEIAPTRRPELQFAYIRLDLSNIGLTSLDDIILDYPAIQHIIVSQNKLKDISLLNYLPDLISLSAVENAIKSIPDLSDLSRLMTISLDHNAITRVEPAAFIENTHLLKLSLSYNPITTLFGLQCPFRLKHIYLDGCKLSTLQGIAHHNSLEFLSVNHSELESLSGVRSFPNLRILHASGNRFSSLHDDILFLTELEELFLDDNRFSSISDLNSLSQLKKLTSLSIVDNAELEQNFSEEEGDDDVAIICAFLMICPSLVFFNSQPISVEQRKATAEYFLKKENEKAEKIRLENERIADEARIAAEAEAARLEAEKKAEEEEEAARREEEEEAARREEEEEALKLAEEKANLEKNRSASDEDSDTEDSEDE